MASGLALAVVKSDTIITHLREFLIKNCFTCILILANHDLLVQSSRNWNCCGFSYEKCRVFCLKTQFFHLMKSFFTFYFKKSFQRIQPQLNLHQTSQTLNIFSFFAVRTSCCSDWIPLNLTFNFPFRCYLCTNCNWNFPREKKIFPAHSSLLW